VPREPLPPIAVAVGFVDAVNRQDVARLSELLTADHRLVVFDEPPLTGRDENVAAWRGYCDSFPSYVIYPHRIAADDDRVAILGHTTGSHLGLADEVEASSTLIWVAETGDGRVREWRLVPDDVARRARYGLA
jgi:limonene-1,2-epoxide hydrolase